MVGKKVFTQAGEYLAEFLSQKTQNKKKDYHVNN